MWTDQNAMLSDTWHELARGSLRQTAHWRNTWPGLSLPLLPSVLLGHMPLAQVRFHHAQYPMAAIKLYRSRFTSTDTYGQG